jgi:phosphoglycerate dehydrogenase-like enzyme
VNDSQRTVLIASHLEADLVERIRGADDRIKVLWEPDLLPVPRYAADHNGTHRDLEPVQIERWRSLLSEAEISFDFDWWRPAELATNAPRLRWVQATSSGIGEKVERLGLDATDITFTTAAGVHADPLAEFALFGLLWIVRDAPTLGNRQADRVWERYTSRQLAGRRVLVVGLGHVGRRIAELCAAAKMDVWAAARPGREQQLASVNKWVMFRQLAEALPDVDALVLACPLTEETFHLVGRAELDALPPHAALVNVARGQVVDEPALVRALAERRLAGAVLDVFEHEPLPEDSPLWRMPNVLVSPHSASTVEEENSHIVDLFIDNLRRDLDDRPLVNEYIRERSY